MTKLDRLNADRFDNDIETQVENKQGYQKLLDCCIKMIDEQPTLERGLIGYMKHQFLTNIKECDIQIDYLSREKKDFLKKFKDLP